MSPVDPLFALVTAGIFAGAVVSGLIGFAFSAVAGAILLHVLPPIEAVPLMMACTIVTQSASLWALRKTMRWRCSLALIAGGICGVLPALYLLHHVEAQIFRIGFGAFLVAYAGYMLLRPAAARCGFLAALPNAVVGFGGGLIGGLTAMPGALPAIWCDMRGLPKEEQRGLVQPYITAMQAFALIVLLAHNNLPSDVLLSAAYGLPVAATGAAVGLLIFNRINDAWFRGATLSVLLVAGCVLVV